ncbi:hypothetical protein [Mycolicibacterium aubagnense]|uniref:Transcriptional regulator n=1 Tax=Mycolicibacterium aubagnense TaxID=319707 RepID=A0ABN5Z1D5_9MYCO|nr:hypothetical protein [Mycolicibacterium aubagnense]WGI31621.1 hypothetical protein QDT91_20670 [Mycolicibacterium aubagnense]BBX86909.1 hypothetical protein MAUB_47820 [Mycolicibacterium aubagnense]
MLDRDWIADIEFRRDYAGGIAPCTARRHRRDDPDWPESRIILGRLYYRRKAVEAWLERLKSSPDSRGCATSDTYITGKEAE